MLYEQLEAFSVLLYRHTQQHKLKQSGTCALSAGPFYRARSVIMPAGLLINELFQNQHAGEAK